MSFCTWLPVSAVARRIWDPGCSVRGSLDTVCELSVLARGAFRQGLQTAPLWDVAPSALTRDRTCAPCIGSAES